MNVEGKKTTRSTLYDNVLAALRCGLILCFLFSRVESKVFSSSQFLLLLLPPDSSQAEGHGQCDSRAEEKKKKKHLVGLSLSCWCNPCPPHSSRRTALGAACIAPAPCDKVFQPRMAGTPRCGGLI